MSLRKFTIFCASPQRFLVTILKGKKRKCILQTVLTVCFADDIREVKIGLSTLQNLNYVLNTRIFSFEICGCECNRKFCFRQNVRKRQLLITMIKAISDIFLLNRQEISAGNVDCSYSPTHKILVAFLCQHEKDVVS